ncbi:unnamed protein product [Rotaria sp. Silwood1]|nr:unnamed protein product [Rotaria sp. Silwood1]
MDNYEYMEESTIPVDLICKLCKKPFIDPVILPSPCEQTFCLKCIQTNLENHSNNCSECNKKPLSNNDLKSENPILRKMLGKLLVKCCSCSEENIQRSNFSEHIQQQCPKRIVDCSANDILCPWNGHYDELNEHFNHCPYEKLRTVLIKLINDARRIDELNQLQIDFQSLENKYQEQQNRIQQIENENEILNNQINEMKKFEIENKNLNEQLNKLENFEIENKSLNEKIDEHINEINELKSKNQLIQDQCDQYEINNNDIEIELKILNESLQLTNIVIENFQAKIKFFQENLNQLNLTQINNQTLNELYQQQQIQNDSLDKQNQYLQETIVIYEQELEHLQEYCKQIDADNQQYFLNNKENQHLKVRLTEYEKEIEQLKQYCKQIEAANQQYFLINEENNHLKAQLIKYEKQIEQLKQYCEQIEANNQQLIEQSIQYKIKIDQLTINIKRLEAKLDRPVIQSHIIADQITYNNNQLVELIDKCQTGELVNLNGQKINDHDIDIVINKALINKQCQSLILWNNCLTSYSISRLFSFLNMNITLKKLSISNNHLSDESIKSLSESLSFKNVTLKELVLSSNEITDQGLIYLSDMLKTNETLIVLGLQDNNITDKAIQYLCQVIQSDNKTIEEISLYSNKLITDTSIDYIFNMITNNQSLKTFWIWNCHLSKQGKHKLQQSIQSKSDFDLRL